MKLSSAIIATLLLGCIQVAYADGPPINMDGTISVPYKAIALDANQKIQLRSARSITLTPLQKKQAEITSSVNELFILTCNYNDCTCGLTYGIWFHTDSIAVFGTNYSSHDTMPNGAILPGRALRLIDYIRSKEHNAQCLTISDHGDIYYMNQKRSLQQDSLYALAEEIASNLAALHPPQQPETEPTETEEQSLFLYIPPLYGAKHREKILFTFYKLNQFNSSYRMGNFIYQ